MWVNETLPTFDPNFEGLENSNLIYEVSKDLLILHLGPVAKLDQLSSKIGEICSHMGPQW